MVAGIAIVTLNSMRMSLSNNMAFCGQDFGKGIPVISEEGTVCQMFYFVIKSPEGCSITTAEHPGHSSPCATVNSLDDPKLVFFCQ
jgi:hypothetical protein